MKYIKSFIRIIAWNIWLCKAKKKANQMDKDNDVLISKIGKIIIETIEHNVSEQEKQWVDKIEELRRSLNRNNNEIVITDFGAGDPDSNRSESEMHIGKVNSSTISEINQASKPPFWALILFKLIREFKPQTALELGTCLGISASYQASALTLNSKGKLVTMEGAQSLVELSKENFNQLGLNNIEIVSGRFSDNLHNVLEQNKPIDYVFIDGHHDKSATIQYFEAILPYLSEDAILVFDDIAWSKGMKSAWEEITKNQRLKIIIDFNLIGICILNNKQTSQRIIKF